jgi:RimJ/RimL family protein N-acetyltransferase
MRILETGRLALRWLDDADAGFMHELLNDPDWLRYIGDRGIRSVEDAHCYIVERLCDTYARHGFGVYMVELRGNAQPLGICGLIKRDWLDDVDLGFAFLPQFRGNGYALEAASATLKFARSELGLTRIVAIVSPDNRDSIRLLEKLGMQFERMATPPLDAREVCLFASTGP